MISLELIRNAGLTLAAIAGGLAAIGYIYRQLSNGMTLANLLQALPSRLAVLEGKVDGLHERMDTADSSHDETLAIVTKLSDDVATQRAEDTRWREEHGIDNAAIAERVERLEAWRRRTDEN